MTLQKLCIVAMIGIMSISFPLVSWGENKPAEVSAAPGPEKKGKIESVTDQPSTLRDDEDYQIGAGDVLDISVWKDEALTRSCVVRPDGAISFPLIGDVRAAGKTAAQIKADIENKPKS